MKKQFLLFSSIFLFGLLIFSCQQKSGHPRILLLEGEEEVIREQINSVGTWAKIHEAILAESEEIIKLEPRERVQVGRRILGISREYLRRIFYVSYAYRLTGDQRFSSHAEAEMLEAAAFSDWNPSHFLDVAEMTMALAIGYDWIFDKLSDESKQIIREAIVKKGLEQSFIEEYNWFLTSEHNWNQVCNAGMTFGALAVQEDYPDLAQTIIDRAFESIPHAMIDYGPDGAFPEGYGYWGYGTSFNLMFLNVVEKAFGSDRGLSEIPGFLNTGTFLQHMLAPSFRSYNWGDNHAGGGLSPAMFWFASKNNDPSLLWMQKHFLEGDDYSRYTGNRLLPAIMIWGKDIPLNEIQEPDNTFWVGQGKNPVALMRTSWTVPSALYLGFKAGSPSVNHGHMDIGSFIIEANGERWVSDLGSQNYNSLEQLGMDIWNKAQDSERWTVFRLNNFSHSTLIVDDKLQHVDGYAKIDKSSDNKDFMFAISDISGVYDHQLKKAVRGVGIIQQKYFVIRDELVTLNKSTTVRWNMLTSANVELCKSGAILSKEGKKLNVKVKGPKNIKMKTWSTAPTNDYDTENPETILVGFECDLPANSSEKFEVLLVPDNLGEKAEFIDKNLSDW